MSERAGVYDGCMWLKAHWKWLILTAWVYAFLAVVSVTRLDYDYGWHYRSGEYILRHGVPRLDVFTYTATDFAWVNHEWLNDVLMYLLASGLGYGGLGLVFAGIWTAALRLGADRRLNWPAVGLALGALVLFVGTRPLAWTALGLAVCLRILAGRRERWWWLVPLFAVWANLHAGFAIGLALVAMKAVLERSGRLALWGLAAVAVTLLNPYGPGVYVELWRTISDAGLAGRIGEWSPMYLNLAVLPYLLAAGVMVVMQRRWDFDRWRSAGLILAGVSAGRHLTLLVVGTLALVSERVAIGLAVLGRKWQVVAAAAVGVGFPLLVLLWPPATGGGSSFGLPEAELTALKASPCQGNLFNNYNYGGAVINALPGTKVYIDGRMPSWVGPRGSYLDLYVRVQHDGGFADAEFERYGVKCALLSSGDRKLSAHLANSPGWRRAVGADGAELWRRD